MSSYAGKENQCRNFAPNIFNKNKCQNCFKPRETHLLSDKDLNKATPIFFGWILLAPIGTDFDNPSHRSRKWQRRHFVLFEHGALRYALDDNINTLPQGTINMNQCTDVVQAEAMTGQKNSLCIYHPEMKYFIRFESKDDAMAWYDQLIVFPQTVKQDALNKRRFARKYGSAKATPSPPMVDDVSQKALPLTPDGKRKPESFNDKLMSPETVERRPHSEIKRGRSISRKSTDMKQGTQTADNFRRRAKSLDRDSHELNDITIESLNQRRGWLMKMENAAKDQWNKHWFVLAGNSLKYYQDPAAEEYSQPDGEVNLSDVVNVQELDMRRNYGFTINIKDGEEITLAAVTSGIRRNWMNSFQTLSSNMEKTEPDKAVEPEQSSVNNFDESMVETVMLRRARMRARRKAGRARTYDFAELRSSVPATIDTPLTDNDTKVAEMEFHKPVAKTDLDLPITTNTEDEMKVEENGFLSPEVQNKEIVISPKLTSPRTPRTPQQENKDTGTPQMPLTSQMFQDFDSRWERIEKSDIYSNLLPNENSSLNNSHQNHIEDSSIADVCNSLKSEVEYMERQIEKSQREFSDVLDDQNLKLQVDDDDALKGAGTSTKKVTEDVNVDKMRALEIAHKCAMEENKRLREEILQSRLTKEQESSRMQTKIRDLKNELAMVNKRARIKSSLKSEANDRSLKDKVSELEAEMEDTGQMLARRLSALEHPRRKETDDSDEAGSSSSCSSINMLMKMGKSEEEKSEPHGKDVSLDSAHQRLTETIKSLQDVRSSSEFGTSAVQEAFNMNKATVISLQKKLLDDQKNWLSVKKCLQELKTKITDVQNEKQNEPKHLLPFLESVLNDTLQMMEKGNMGGDISSTPESSKRNKARDSKELERDTVERLKILSDQLKTTTAENSGFSSKHSLNSSTSSLNTALDNSASKIPFEQKERLFAEQLSHEAMVIAEMAGTLERYASGKNAVDSASYLLHSDTQDIFPENKTAQDDSNLLQYSGIVAEKLLLESRLVTELSKLQTTTISPGSKHDYKSSSLPLSGTYGKQSHGNLSGHHGMVEETASLSLVQAQVNYMLHVYNDRIARLSQDVKEAQHRADTFQQKLHELVHACKTRDVELVSQIAVEVDTKAALALTVEDLPEWRQQVDYGMLHGAQASISSIDLQAEASYFAKLSQDISSMSSDISSLTGIGTRILELDVSLSKALKPSVIGDKASIIAYEAISQAQLLFLCRRITKDYEEEILKMKSAVRKQNAHFNALQTKLKEMENGDAAKMKQLTKEHKQKVERLMQQLALVEQARQEMTSEMDQKLNKLSHKQQREMERSEARHKKETEDLHEQLKKSKLNVEHSTREYTEEINKLKSGMKDLQEHHNDQMSVLEKKYEEALLKEKKESKKKIDILALSDSEKMEKLKAEFRKELEDAVSSHEREIIEINEQRDLKVKHMKEKHKRQLENEKEERAETLLEMKQEWEAKLKEKQDMLDSLQKMDETKVSKAQHDAKISELEAFFEKRFSDFQDKHQKELDEIEQQYQLDVKRLEEEKAREMDEDVNSTKKAIMSMRKHYQDELIKMKDQREEPVEQDPELQKKVEELRRELEALSELYSDKCVEITNKDDEIRAFEERLLAADESNQVLKEQNNKLSSQLETEIGEMKTSSLMRSNEGDDVHHLRIELGSKKLQVAILQQQMESLKQQVAVTLQGRLFLRHGDQDIKSEGYDLMKSKSQPHFPTHDDVRGKSVKRRSSERRAASKVTSHEE